jgi:hypothetical protein
VIEDWIHKEMDKGDRKRGTRDRGRFAGNGGQGERKGDRKRGTRDRGRFAGNGGQGERKGDRKRGQGIKEKIQKDVASDRGRDTESGG